MSQFYLINAVSVAGVKILPGELIDDAVTPTAPITGAGGLLWPASDATVAAAALRAQSAHKNRGANEAEMESIMQTAVQAVQKGLDVNTVTAAGSSAVATGVSPVISAPGLAAGSKIEVSRTVPSGSALGELMSNPADRVFGVSGTFQVKAIRNTSGAPVEVNDFSTFDYEVIN